MLEWWEFALRLGCAFALGALVGVERQWRARMAGLRTNALVSVGSALFVLLAANVVDEVSPTRVAAQVVSGIGFLGAGVILRDGINVRGINTAATIWCAAAVGVLAGSGLYVGAAMGAVTVVAANVLLRPVARRLQRRSSTAKEIQTVYQLRIVCRDSQDTHVRALLLQALSDTEFTLRSLESGPLGEERESVAVSAEFVAAGGHQDEVLEQVVKRLSLEPEVSAVHWQSLDEESD